MNLSYWELDTYFRHVDFVIIGSGIVGLSTAYHLQKKYPKEKIYHLVERRYKGLQKLRRLLGDRTIDFQQQGGYEIFRSQDKRLMEHSLAQIDRTNQWLKPIFGEYPFKIS